MAFNYYGGVYQPGGFYNGGMQMPYQQMQQPVQTQAVQNTSERIYVQGEEAAKAYLVAPGNCVTLWDSEKPTIYIKAADGNGMPSMRILDYIERSASAPAKQTVDMNNYITRDEFENRISALVKEEKADE